MYRIILIALAAAPLSAQTVEDAVAKQRESLAKQRASVQKQTSTARDGSFFLLPRATSLGGVTGSLPACDPLPDRQVDALVGQTATREGVSPDLLRTVMKQESGFRPCAVSSKGAMGLMQLMPETAEQFGITNPFDAASNLDAGARFLKELLTKYGGDLPKTLGAYNAGPAKVNAAGTVPAIPETMDYVRQILAARPFR
jgi:hypothetical protein